MKVVLKKTTSEDAAVRRTIHKATSWDPVSSRISLYDNHNHRIADNNGIVLRNNALSGKLGKIFQATDNTAGNRIGYLV
jgi:hypothetical protein